MGSANLSPFSAHHQIINPNKISQLPRSSPEFRCRFSFSPEWGPNPGPFRPGRFGFDDEFGFGRERKKRGNWWSDDEDEDDDDDDDDDDDYYDDGFWFSDELGAFDWVFKILGAFGWMVPAIIVSTLTGTGTNSLIMAIVLPLGQTALSLVFDRLWGSPAPSANPRPRTRSKYKPKPRPRPRKSPFNGNSNRGARRTRTGTRPDRWSHPSWEAANGCAAKKAGKSRSRFGGWDELLDEQDASSGGDFSREGQIRESDEPLIRDADAGKLSRRRTRDKPLFMRLLVAVFPFLGSWSQFLL